jgi:hypothetical protein
MAAIDDLIKQIQSRSNTSQWSGGYGADAATKDMARILSSIGITNIKDFGKIDKYEPVEQIGMTLNGQPVQGSGSQLYVLESVDTGDGTDYVRRDLSPEQVAQVKPIYGVPTGYDENTQPTYRTVEATNVAVKDGQLVGVTGQTFGNKLTGQEVPNTYTERQTGDFFGGTYEGKGNTGYGVQFDAQGLPIFYTQGASSKDAILTDLMPMVQLALLATGAGGLLGNTLLGAGANQVAAGALGGALLGGGTAAIAGQDVLKGALLGGAGGAISGYLNPATGQVSAVPAEGTIPVSANDIAQLGGQGTAGFYDEITGAFINDPLGGLSAPLTNATSGIANITAPTSGYYDEITGKFISDPLGGLTEPLTNATSGTNIDSMAGYNYNATTGDWTLPTGEVIGTTVNPNPVTSGGDIMRNAGALPPLAPVAEKAAATAAKGLGVSDAIRLAGVAATIAGINEASKPTGSGGFPIVPIPSDWTSPIKPTGTAAFTPLAPIDFGNKEMLRGTQWEQLLSPDYGKAPAMPTSTNPSNMTFNELTKILGGSTTSAPSQNLSINDVIAGIQSQYGQTPTGSMG